MVALLGSPLHPLLSRSVMVLQVRGRRSGRVYRFPVMYAEDGDSMWVFPAGAEHKTWWRNLIDPAPVTVRVRGRTLAATGRAIRGADQPDAAARGLAVWQRRFPRASERVGLTAAPEGRPDKEAVARLAERGVLVQIRPRPWPVGGQRSRNWLALLGVLGVAFYLLLTLLVGLLWEGYDPLRQTQSELGAVDSPYGAVMNVAGFMGLGVTIMAFAAAYHRTLRSSLARQVATALLLVAGTGMVVVGFFPCDAGCVDVTATGRLHSWFSMPGAIGLPVAAMVSSLAFRRDGRWGTAWQVVSFWLGLLSLVAGPVVAAEVVAGANGLLQRAAMWPSLLWMAAVSVRILRAGWGQTSC